MTQGARSVRSRYPLGILVIVALTVVRCLSIVAALFKIQGGDVAQWLRDTSPLPDTTDGTAAALIATAILIGLLAASLATIVGLFAWRTWAWVLAIILSGIILAIDLGWWYSGEPRYLSMLLNVIAVFYLNQRDVRLALHGEATT
ncbi:MAG TPA: hypothetical protein VGQ31_10685 [Candidatus Limnocylindrales bacterium]|jgi:uncharacterized membrane protein YphA (DoxX/SURF4 family)|nr:hypothetical protein [Candidatus Limnocylindrales bacterium]